MQIRYLYYLTALARRRHFGRAAEECGITQPALSQALRHLETHFGIPIVERRNQGFHGFTREGERVLDWCRAVLGGLDALKQELPLLGSGKLSGHIRIGVIPVAMPMVSILTTAFNRQYPDVAISVFSMNVDTLVRRIEAFEIDLGITYLDHGETKGMRPYDLYDETYFLIAPEKHAIASRPAISWREAGALPLCMLTPDMQNRRILDRLFADAGVVPRTVIETDCALALCSHVRPGHWFAVVPNTFFLIVADWTRTRAIPLVEPRAVNRIGILVGERTPPAPVTAAFIDVAQSAGVMAELRIRPA